MILGVSPYGCFAGYSLKCFYGENELFQHGNFIDDFGRVTNTLSKIWSVRLGDALKVSKTGLTFLRTIVVIAGVDDILLPLNGHWLIIFCLTNFRARSIMFHPRTRSSKSLETFLQGKMCREGVKPRCHRRISSHWQDFHFE